jgi:hypothetical protein
MGALFPAPFSSKSEGIGWGIAMIDKVCIGIHF